MELANRVLELMNDDNIEKVPTTFCEALDELKKAVYLRASDEIDDDQLFDTVCYAFTAIGATLAYMGYDADTLKSNYVDRMAKIEEAINNQ